MKRTLSSAIFLLFALSGFAQNVRTKAVELRSHYTKISGTETLTVYWPKDTSASSYKAFIRDQATETWNLISVLSKTDSFVTIPSYTQGQAVDIWVVKKWQIDSASGYIHTGENVNSGINQDILLLLIDSNYVQPLSSEIARLVQDLTNENWLVRSHVVQRTDSVQQVKNWIENQWVSDSTQIQSVLLLGHVPVPYSGNINPDGHPDHQGAWPADVYYVTFDLAWTDQTVNTTSATRTANQNIPGDNKFDQDYIWPARARIPLGRVDLYDMPAFGNDTLLMRQYLNKNHLYRTGKLQAKHRSLIDDNFGYFGGEAFASNGWRAFTPIFDTAIYPQKYFSSMKDSSFLFSYACGGGTYTSASGVGSSSNFVSDSLLNPFTMLFGSYFGDWDNQNNFLRAPLASKGWGLISAWAGRPLWMFHHAALNVPVGRAAMESQNAYPDYDAGYSGTYVHIALMGDPSLRLYVHEPPLFIRDSSNCVSGNVALHWSTSETGADSVLLSVTNIKTTSTFSVLFPASDSSYAFTIPIGDYTAKLSSKRWERNPSGNFPVMSHPIAIAFTSKYAPIAKLSATEALCFGDTLYFSDSSTSSGHQNFWTLDGQLISTAKDSSYLISPGNQLLALQIIDSNQCLSIAALPIYAAPRLYFDTLKTSTQFPSIACDSQSNKINILAIFGPSNANLLFYWGDSSQAISYSGSSHFQANSTFWKRGSYHQKLYLSDSTGLCQIIDSSSFFIAPRPPRPILIPTNLVINKIGIIKDQQAFDSSNTYHWSTNTDWSAPGDSVNKLQVSSTITGVFFAKLHIENSYGCLSDTATGVINIIVNSVQVPHGLSMEIYPNPSHKEMMIQFDQEILVSEVYLINALGQQIKMEMEQNGTKYRMDLQAVSRGSYTLMIKTDKGNFTAKVVKD